MHAVKGRAEGGANCDQVCHPRETSCYRSSSRAHRLPVQTIRAKLDAATKLLGNLDGEQDRWKEQHAAVTKQLGYGFVCE